MSVEIKKDLVFFNTKTRSKDLVQPLEPARIRMYTCGPTVYNRAHIGNFRTYVFEDLLRRTIKAHGYSIEQVMNLTDVDDKTIRGAIEQGVSLDEFTAPFKQAFFDDMDTLGIERVEHYPAATDFIAPMIAMIESLMEKGAAYQGKDGSVYYKIESFPAYGCLSHLKIDELQAGASQRVDSDEYDKEQLCDFVLWKAHDPERDGDIFWESPFGNGRPGWHLECSAMATEILGPTVDIHVGGVDNIFPHHENEIAQSEACTGETFANHWMHAQHLIVDGKKMSKSLGNFFTLQDLLDKGYTGKEVRYMLLQTHYRTQLNFTFDEIEAVRASLKRVNGFIRRLQDVQGEAKDGFDDPILNEARTKFYAALADDLNISVALAVIFDFSREINALIDANQFGYGEAQEVLELMKEFDAVLNVMSFDREQATLPEEVEQALADRKQARADKNWTLSDELRDKIRTLGYAVEDSPTGQKVEKV